MLERAPGVREVAVVGLPDDRWGQAVTAFVVLDDEAIGAHDGADAGDRARSAADSGAGGRARSGAPDPEGPATAPAVVPDTSAARSAAARLDAFCLAGGDLARFKRPRCYHFTDALPKSPSGKILRRLLRERST